MKKQILDITTTKGESAESLAKRILTQLVSHGMTAMTDYSKDGRHYTVWMGEPEDYTGVANYDQAVSQPMGRDKLREVIEARREEEAIKAQVEKSARAIDKEKDAEAQKRIDPLNQWEKFKVENNRA